MTTECFIPRQFRSEAQTVIDQANAIIAKYQEQGFALTSGSSATNSLRVT